MQYQMEPRWIFHCMLHRYSTNRCSQHLNGHKIYLHPIVLIFSVFLKQLFKYAIYSCSFLTDI